MRRFATAADNLQQPGEIWVLNNDPKTTLQILRSSSQEFASLRWKLANVLKALYKVVTGQVQAYDLNQH